MSAVKSSSPPLGLLSIAAFIRKYGYEVKILDAQVDGFDLKVVEAFKPDVVGLTAMTMYISSAAQIAKAIKENFPNIQTVLGGVHVTAEPERTKERYQFDNFVLGEGELSFSNLLGNDGFFETLDDLPYPAYDLVDLSKYRLSIMGTTSFRSIGLVTSRGCFGKCTFCCRKVFPRFRWNSAEYVINELDFFNRQYGITDFLFYDDLFVGNKKRLREICEKLIGRGYTWSCCSRCDTMDRKTLELMKKAGCWMIEYGIESGNQEILNLMKKGITKEQIHDTISKTSDAGIVSKGNFIFGNFGETVETLEETISFACGLKLDYFQHTFLAPLPGTEAYERADDFGDFNPDWEMCNTFRINFIPKGITKGNLIRLSKKAWRRFYLRPRIIWQELKKLRNLESMMRLLLSLEAFLKSLLRKSG